MRVDPSSITALRSGLEGLADAVERITFQMVGESREQGEAERDTIVRTIREYLLPRLRDPDAPVVAAVVGPTGTGKSMLVNSLAGEVVSPSGPLRPTTSAPVMWAHREHAGRSWSEFVAKVRERVGPALEVVVGDHDMTRDLTVIDAPPFDLSTSGGSAARQLMSLADLCVFVTTGLRYADAASWAFLTEIHDRGLPIVFVLNRLAAEEREEVMVDFATRLAAAGMLQDPDPTLLFAIAEQTPNGEGFLPGDAVATIHKELSEVSDPEFRHGLVFQTAEGVSRSVAERAATVRHLVEAERDAADRLVAHVEEAYSAQTSLLSASLESGDLAWLVEHDHWPSVAVDLTGIVTCRAGVAAQASAAAWSQDPVGSRFLNSGGQGLWRHSHDTTYESQRLLEGWAAGLENLAASRAPGRLGRSRRRRSAEYMWKVALDPSTQPPRPVRRAFRTGIGDLGAAASASLVDTLGRALQGDAARFLGLVGTRTATSSLSMVDREVATVRGVLDASGWERAAVEPPDPGEEPLPLEDDPEVTTGFVPTGSDGEGAGALLEARDDALPPSGRGADEDG